ncbi:alpha/beta hydrolase [Tepidibacillus fermentans]|uniref:Lysophospholipase n=1 Tax=Tepidibacillus fermentans TaxID=1281767 RepID=A0A4R3KKN7_9BACI|nr:alpha/beta hydrolase [Tepidibacillus fermentans]TCS84453.1 lysophospholipase [Tepidibacillus fermentans]
METLQKFLVQPSKAIVLTIHGAGEHIGRYHHFAEWLNQNQISMIGGDLPGLGRSKERRGHIQHFDDYLKKVDQWLFFAIEQFPNLPIFLFGHSMGGLITLRYLEEYGKERPLSGVVLTSPAIRIGMEIPRWQLTLARFMEKIWPTLRLKSGIKAEELTHDLKIIKANQIDPLVYGKVTIRWFFQFQQAIEEVWKKVDRIKRLRLPMLYLQAGEDTLIDPKASKEFIKQLDPKRVEFHFLPGLYHEVLNELEREKYLKMISDWILNQLK